MTKLKGRLDPISRQFNGTTYFMGADGEMHPSEQFYHCGECKYFGRIGDSRKEIMESGVAFCAGKGRYKVCVSTLSCQYFEEVESNG